MSALAWWRPPGFRPWPTTPTTDQPAKNSQLVGVTLDDWDKNAKLETLVHETVLGGDEIKGTAKASNPLMIKKRDDLRDLSSECR